MKLVFSLLCAFIVILLGSCRNEDVNIVYDESLLDSSRVVKIVAYKSLNKSVLQDVEAKIDSSKILLCSPYITNPDHIVLTIETEGGGVLLPNGKIVNNGESFECDLTHPFSIIARGTSKKPMPVECLYSGLPIVEINNPDVLEEIGKESWYDKATIKIINIDGTIDVDQPLSIKGRGNATFGHPKKGLALKLSKKTSVLGMPKSKRWVLLSNCFDKSLIKNALGFEISRCSNLDYTPRGTFVEFVYNGIHKGCYYLCEKIKIEEGRVDISVPGESGVELSGGYILELDSHFDELYKFRSQIKNIPYMFKDPDKVTQEQFEYIKNYINHLENSIYNEDLFKAGEYNKYIDIQSFVDWWIALEVTQNQEPNHPASCFVTKERNLPLKMGPVWDYDVYTFNSVYRLDTLAIRNAIYYDKLFDSKEFVVLLKKRWYAIKPMFDSYIPLFIDNMVRTIYHSAELNHYVWPYKWEQDVPEDWSSPYNGFSWYDSYSSFDDSIEKIKESFSKKVKNVDSFINKL